MMKCYNIQSSLLTIILLLACQLGDCQEQRFSLNLVVGLNFSELEGNSITDYFGLNAGLIGSAKLRKRRQLSLELLYSQNAEYILPVAYPTIQYGAIRLNHIEIPLHIDWLISNEKVEGMISGGLTFSKLLNYYIEDSQGREVTNQVVYENTIGVGIQAGASYFFNEKLGFNFRATFPLETGLDWTIAGRFIYRI